jgi:RpiR family transcriptional regulator, carbohydrate utilization regulator
MDEIKNGAVIGNDLFVRIRFIKPSLTKVEKKIADYILDNPVEILNMNLAELAEEIHCSQASTLRFCRRLGIDGFPKLKLHLSMSIRGFRESDTNEDIGKDDSIKQIMEKVFDFNMKILRNTLELVSDDTEKALQAFLSAQKLYFFALGDAVIPCSFAQFQFSKIGVHSYVCTDPDVQLTYASMTTADDVAIAISHSGRSKNVVEAMKVAKARGATTICITKRERSPLTKCCDIKLFTATVDTTTGKTAVARRIAEQAILESLFIGVYTKKNHGLMDKMLQNNKLLEINKI